MRAALALLFLTAGATFAQPVVPDPAQTPGSLNPAVMQETIGVTICQSGWTVIVRPPYPAMHAIKVNLLRQMRGQGYAVGMQDVELDHLIPLSLGGSPDDMRNLWLEPRAGIWSAARKDDVEAILPRLVCDGIVPLAVAQQAIASDWTEAWERYIGGQ